MLVSVIAACAVAPLMFRLTVLAPALTSPTGVPTTPDMPLQMLRVAPDPTPDPSEVNGNPVTTAAPAPLPLLVRAT